MNYVRRTGDERPFQRDRSQPLSMKPTGPVRWLPRHGEPWCVIEALSQAFVKALAWAPLYTALIVTVTLLLVFVWHL